MSRTILSVSLLLASRGARWGLILPVGPEANHYWRRGRGGQIYRTPEAVEWAETVWASALVQTQRAPRPWYKEDEVVLSFFWYRATLRGDLDNRLKPLLDALQTIAYTNDKQVRRILAERVDGAQVEGYPEGCYHVIVEAV